MVMSLKLITHWPQWQAGLSLSLVLLVTGFTKGWTSPTIARLTAPDNTDLPKLTLSEASWIVSLPFLGKLLGSVIGAAVQEFIGRKKTLLYSGGPLILGWALVLIGTSVPWLYVSRFLCGFSMGMTISSVTSFLGEIANPKIRGILILWNVNSLIVGTFFGNTMGTFLTMEMFSYVSLAVSGLFIALFSLVPESPYYYMANDNIVGSEKSLQWYMGTIDVKKELHELQGFVDNTSVSLMRRIKECNKPPHRRNLIVICCLNVFIYGAGENTVLSYAEVILIKSKVSMKPSTVVMVLSFCNMLLGFIAAGFVDKFGRRPLLIISGFGVCIAQALLGFHFHMLSLNFEPSSISWLPVFALFLHYSSMGFGLGPVPYALSGELFPPILKTLATFCFTVSGALLSFLLSKTFQPYLDLVGEKFVFLTFAISALSSVVFTYFIVPETKQMSLVDIQQRNLDDKTRHTMSSHDFNAEVGNE